MNALNNMIEQKIADLLIKSPEFQELSKKLDVYCPFEALSVERAEIRHSNFLADIINPNRVHGFSDNCLKVFLGGLFDAANETLLHLSTYLDDGTYIQIFREWHHIDLLIILHNSQWEKKIISAIEIKIYANESKGQLSNYDEKLIKNFKNEKILKFFLTPDARESSKDDWIPVSFQSFIDGWNEVLRSGSGTTKARMMLESYIKMIQRKFMSNPDLEKIAKTIWAKHRSALEYLIEQQPNPISEVLKELAEYTFLSKTNQDIQKIDKSIEIIVDSYNARYLRYAVTTWDKIPHFKSCQNWTQSKRVLLYEIEAANNSIRARFVLGPGQSSIREQIYNILLTNKVDLKRKRKNITNEFTRMSSSTIANEEIINAIIDEQNTEKGLEKIKDKIIKEILKIFPSYHNAIIQLLGKHNSNQNINSAD